MKFLILFLSRRWPYAFVRRLEVDFEMLDRIEVEIQSGKSPCRILSNLDYESSWIIDSQECSYAWIESDKRSNFLETRASFRSAALYGMSDRSLNGKLSHRATLLMGQPPPWGRGQELGCKLRLPSAFPHYL